MSESRLLPSASRWNFIVLDFKLAPNSSTAYESIPSQYPKSVDFNLAITDRKHFHIFIFVLVAIIFAILAAVLLAHFLPQQHKHQGSSINLKLAINQALTFYDAKKSGHYPRNSPGKFRRDSGLQDGDLSKTDFTGGFYDSGNNIKFTFTTAYTVTLLSWTVVEYRSKYADIGELDHVSDIIRWGSDYLLKQRPEDMKYERPVSICDGSASDLAGEIVAALSASSMVFKEDKDYSRRLVQAAESLFEAITSEDPSKQGTYTVAECGKQARMLYNSTSYKDELAWGATWLFLATENADYLATATEIFLSAKGNESSVAKGLFIGITSSMLWSDYHDHLKMSGASCKTDAFSMEMLRDFSTSQANS
ncbi:Endoglucanase 25 [Glycine max]|nr:Endoglucanase 25 [Glycine max]